MEVNMLIEFKLSNFRSFYGSSVFSMEASSIQEFSKSIIRKSDFRILIGQNNIVNPYLCYYRQRYPILAEAYP